jgi:hypothetical protein
MFWFGRSAQEKLEFYNQELTSGDAEGSPVTLLFLVSFTYKSRTDSEPVAWESFQFENELLNAFQPNRTRISQESRSTPPPDSHE